MDFITLNNEVCVKRFLASCGFRPHPALRATFPPETGEG